MVYRAGFFYGKSNLQLNDNHLQEFGITFGIGVPIGRTKGFDKRTWFSKMNLAFEVGQRGDINVIRETFFRATLGFSLSDRGWFQKRQYN